MMEENESKLKEMLLRLEALSKKQDKVQYELNRLKSDIRRLQKTLADPTGSVTTKTTLERTPESVRSETTSVEETLAPQEKAPSAFTEAKDKILEELFSFGEIRENFEKFIGENLINKIGILITVIGVGIGARFAINNNMISPETRIILGYAMGLGLAGFAIKLKKNYLGFSAVLLSGAMAILYFMTFFAYSFYDLIPDIVAFGLMVLLTMFTVFAALKYDRQIIAHFGLVGAYAVPFLLSSGSGNAVILFSYMAILNIGILVIAFRKYWKPLYYVAFIFTWLIYGSWLELDYQQETDFSMAMFFLVTFFLIFYATILSYKLLRKEQFVKTDIALIMSNAFAFYGLGYYILDGHPTWNELLGLFTLANAVIHFIVSALIYRWKLADRGLFYLVSGLVLLFLTIAVPVQLDGNWVTLIWIGEALLLFWIARNRQIPFYESLSYVAMILSFFSLINDWTDQSIGYLSNTEVEFFTPILNINFLTGFLFVVAFGVISWLYHNKKYEKTNTFYVRFQNQMAYLIPLMLILVLYILFFNEISAYWTQAYANSALEITTQAGHPSTIRNYKLLDFQYVWTINYTMLFLSLMALVNIKAVKNALFGRINLGLMVVVLLMFLVAGQDYLGDLQRVYFNQSQAQYFNRGIGYLLIRYISLMFAGGMLYAMFRSVREPYIESKWRTAFEILFHFSILAILSCELYGWVELNGSGDSSRLGLTILWGVYALFLIGLGIRKKRKLLRMIAFGLLALTLVKLFLYDLAGFDTIGKTVVLVTLGILLLIISFLYNKYKDSIADEQA